MSNYRIETINFDQLENQMTIPTYQRPLVWSKSQKTAFIDNISRGFPFGSLLLYKYDTNEKYSLIDGQQRFSTLREYQRHPEEYFPIETNASKQIDSLMTFSGASLQPESYRTQIRNQFVTAIKEMLHQHAVDRKLPGSYLAQKVKEICPSAGSTHDLEIVDIQVELINALDRYVNLSTLQIPCVFFTGDKSELPDVFANVNLGGRKLTKYQVFAAQWNRYNVRLSEEKYSDEILEHTISRYEGLTEDRDGLEIEDFSAEEMRQERVVTLPEFCHALGELVISHCRSCWPAKAANQDDTVDTIGYNTLAIVFGIRPQEIAGKKEGPQGLPDVFANAGFEDNPEAIERLVTCMLAEYDEINGRFAKYLRKPGSKEAYETSKSSGQLQFLSFFAALWHMRYEPVRSTTFESKPGYRHNGYNETARNLFRCFILDMLTNQWKGSGDSRLGNYIDGTLTYATNAAFSKAKLEAATHAYLESIENSESINVDSTAKTLLTVLASRNLQAYGESSYDIEHLISRETLRSKKGGLYAYKAYKLPGGNLGNIAYLSSAENRAKGSTTLPASQGELFSFNGSREYVYDGQALRDADINLKHGDPDAAKSFLKNRAQIMLDSLVEMLSQD
ncbi:MAG: DUF262 domain-containing protein [Coriobacteriaceae bacterium]|nr:DUF262 domain-containing protein [Coriobacteriaceae bacterium]